MLDRFRLPTRPRARAEAILRGDRWRITVLADGLVRLEWSPDGEFEDRASTLAIVRDLPAPPFQLIEDDSHLEVLTERLHLVYDRGPFSPTGLSVQARGRISNYHSTWRYGQHPRVLGGTARTLDGADGAVPVEGGIASRSGVAVLDDSGSFLLTDDGWIGTRGKDRIDLYVFAYGHDYSAALQAFYALSGPQPVLPRWALGNWWSRYYPYSAGEYLELMDHFAAEDLPFSVAVIDMDWHRVASVPQQYGSGWTGYSWERSLFPDPEGFLAELHRRGLRVTLNVHPHEGVLPFEDAYPSMAAALGVDPESAIGIPFDITDPEFVTAYFDLLHHPLEDQGVDFWWLDWQQGVHSRVPGVDPLWMLNHLHFLDSGRDGRRPMSFSRYAGPGSHRYPIGFSGDAYVSWESLQFQPWFTAAAADVGYGWWSHDIGGHLPGVRDDELATRWVQLGTFSPINRLHSSSNPFLVKEPWMFPPGPRAAMGESLRLRHRLVPYLHTMNHHAARGVPLVRPMYHAHPNEDAAYDRRGQFLFGDSLVVAPITTPADPVTLRGSVRAWLPEGLWVDLFTGAVYDARSTGGRRLELHRDESSIPVLLAAGAVLPLASEHERDAASNPRALELILLPGASGSRELLEDDGSGNTVETIQTTRTPLVWDDEAKTLHVGPATGPGVGISASRDWTLTLLGVVEPGPVRVSAATGPGIDATASVRRGADRVSITVSDVPTDLELLITLPDLPTATTKDVQARLFATLNAAQCGYVEKAAAWALLTGDGDRAVQIAGLQALDLPKQLTGALIELLACA